MELSLPHRSQVKEMSRLNKNLEGTLKRSVMLGMGRDQRSVGALGRSWKTLRPVNMRAPPPLSPYDL